MSLHLAKPPRLRVRPFEPTDRDACLAICASSVPECFSPVDLEDFRVFLGAPRGVYFVASLAGSRGDTIRACGGYHVGADGVGGLTWGMVHADDHHFGLGTQLLRYRLKKIRGDPRAWCVRLYTTPALVGLFRQLGFVQEQMVEDAYGPGLPQVTMRLQWGQAPVATEPTRSGNVAYQSVG